MKRILIALFAFAAITAAAEDSYLYWMVGEGDSGFTYNTVKVSQWDNGAFVDYLTFYDGYGQLSSGDSVLSTVAKNYEDYSGGLFAKLASDSSTSSFVIELFNDSQRVAVSDSLDMSTALADYITHNNAISLAKSWAPVSFAIPEPNSAMLLLIGCAALGLRRRRQRKA